MANCFLHLWVVEESYLTYLFAEQKIVPRQTTSTPFFFSLDKRRDRGDKNDQSGENYEGKRERRRASNFTQDANGVTWNKGLVRVFPSISPAISSRKELSRNWESFQRMLRTAFQSNRSTNGSTNFPRIAAIQLRFFPHIISFKNSFSILLVAKR